MKSKLKVVGAIVVILLIIFGLREAGPSAAKRRFINRWERLLIGLRTPEELKEKLSSKEWSYVWVKKFEDGSWVIARGESVPGGDWFDATLLASNSGRIVITNYRFSGFEGLAEYLSRIPATTADEFVKEFAKQYAEIKGEKDN